MLNPMTTLYTHCADTEALYCGLSLNLCSPLFLNAALQVFPNSLSLLYLFLAGSPVPHANLVLNLPAEDGLEFDLFSPKG